MKQTESDQSKLSVSARNLNTAQLNRLKGQVLIDGLFPLEMWYIQYSIDYKLIQPERIHSWYLKWSVLIYKFLSRTSCRHSGVTGGKQSPITVGTGFQDPSAIGNRPLAELCKLLSYLLNLFTEHCLCYNCIC